MKNLVNNVILCNILHTQYSFFYKTEMKYVRWSRKSIFKKRLFKI